MALGMTTEMERRFAANPLNDTNTRVLRYVLAGCMFQRGIRGENPLWGVDIEELFNAMQLLATRHALEAAPFIGSWHATVDELDVSSGGRASVDQLMRELASSLFKAFEEAVPRTGESRAIDNAVQEAMKGGTVRVGRAVESFARSWASKMRNARPRPSYSAERTFSALIDKRRPRSAQGRVFEATGNAMIEQLVDLVWIEEPERVQYLAPIVEAVDRDEVVAVASLNYDNTIELLCQSTETDYNVGIESWTAGSQLSFPRGALPVIKLHGSIDWAAVEDQSGVGLSDRVSVLDPSKVRDNVRPQIIFGGRNKLTAEGPFLDLLGAFREKLLAANHAVVVGYSFRDDHVNVYLGSWLLRDRLRQITVIGPGVSTATPTYVAMLRDRLPDQIQLIDGTTEDSIAAVLAQP
jgi:hypothetical protein